MSIDWCARCGTEHAEDSGCPRVFEISNSEVPVWRVAVETGRVPGAFWALMTHPKTDSELAIMAYEEVHMLSHQVGAGLITDARLLTETRNELAIQRRDARQEARRTKAALAQRDKRIAHLEERLSRSAASRTAVSVSNPYSLPRT